MALGRGLGSLIPRNEELLKNEHSDNNSLMFVSPERLKPNPEQPRIYFDEEKMRELAESIKNHGVIEPILVTEDGNDYIIVAGERRWRAACLAGVDKIPVVSSNYSDKQILELALIENIQREDLNIIEEAKGYRTLIDKFNYTQSELAEKIGKNRATLANILRILNLPESIQGMILEGIISYGAARALLTLDDEDLQIQIAQQTRDNDLSVREVERLVKQAQSVPRKKKPKTKPDPFIEDLEQTLSQKMDAKVQIVNKKNSGRIEIRYSSLDHLNSILEVLGISQENL